MHLVLKLGGMYRSTAQGLKMRVCMCVRVCVVGGGGSCEKLVFQP